MQGEHTILLVDDEDNILRALTRMLRNDDYTILQTDCGLHGLELLQAHPEVAVILSDQRMPGMTGVEFLTRARELRPDTVRMVLSGYTDLNTITDAINHGEIYKFLTKPWEDDLLRANIAEAFEHYELRFENERLARELQQINVELEQRVEKKTREVLISVHALQISRDVLEHLPVAVVGVDEDGMMVVINQQARLWLAPAGHDLIGQMVDAVLPGEVCEQINHCFKGETSAPFDIRLSETMLNIHCEHMGQTSRAQGVIVVMVQKEHNE